MTSRVFEGVPLNEAFTAATLTDGTVRFRVTASADSWIEADMPPESAIWLAHQLILASRLPYPPPLRLARRGPDGDAS